MDLLNGDILWHLFWLVPIFILLFSAAWKKRKRVLSSFLGERSSDPAFVDISYGARFWRMVCLLLVLVFLFLAAARPFWGTRITPYTGEGRDLLFVFDVSRSMLAQDVKPGRLEHAKYLVREIVKNNPGDRFGLIAFAGKAFLECPMTMDKTSFLQNVDDLSPSSIPVGGTNIEEALKTALAAFKAAESSHLAIILITDGDELTGAGTKVVDEFIRKKIPLFIAGIGDPSEPSIIQYKDEKGALRTLRDNQGNIVKSTLNEPLLSSLAAKSGGIYVRSGSSNMNFAPLQARIRALDKQARESGKQYRPIERPLYPLSAALVFLFLYFVLPEKRRKRKNDLLLFFAVPVLLIGTLPLEAQENNKEENDKSSSAVPVLQNLPAGQNGVFAPRSVPLPEKSVSALPESTDPYFLYNTARNAHFEEKDPQKAEKLYQMAINFASDKENIRSGACLNLGVLRHDLMRQEIQEGKMLLQKQNLQKALEKVKESIRKSEAIQELYKYGLLGATAEKAAHNQQLLLNEKREAEKLQKEIEDLLKKQQHAQKDTQQAADQQQQQQQEKDQKKKEEKKQETQQQTSKAENSAKEMKEQAQKLGQNEMSKQAEKAENALKQAGEALKKGEEEKARKALQEALKALGADKKDNKKEENKENKGDPSGKKDKEEKEKENQQQQTQRQQSPQQNSGEKAPQRAKEEKRDFDKEQAESLLDLMVKDEKNLKDALKKRLLEMYGSPKVEKDW
ncbi:MAG: VWA domain-containing protein [Lentisphaeria bacterium]|nr:VWA domain-containing protein [Lentisphaeria bacterium]